MMILMTALLTFGGQDAPAARAADPTVTVKASPADDADSRIVCQNIVRTGTRLPAKRYCMSAFEWRMMANRTKRDVTDLQRRSQMEHVPSF